jgi:hypothetical protein
MWGKTIRVEDFDEVRKPIIFFPDAGEETEATNYYRQLGWRGRVARVDWPDGCKDPNDLHMHCKDTDIINAIERAR